MSSIDISNTIFEIAREQHRVETSPGDSIIADHGSIVVASYESIVIAERCSFVIAQKGSEVLALPGSVVIFEEGATIQRCQNSYVTNRKINIINPPFEFAKKRGEVFANGRIIVAYPGAELEAGHNSVVIALSRADIKVGNFSTVVAAGYCNVVSGINCNIYTDKSCTVRRENLLPFPNQKKKRLDTIYTTS